MSRVRLSTVALAVVFAGVLTLYVEVRPPPASVAGSTTETGAAPSSPRSTATATPTTAPPSRATPPVPSSTTEPIPSTDSTPEPSRAEGAPRTTPTPTTPTSSP